MEIRMITKAEADDIIATREPRGLFYLDTGKSFVGIDNSTGYAWTEEFDTLPKCRAWLLQEQDEGPATRTLCDECQHSEQRQPCDFDMSTGMCRRRKKNTPNDFEEVKRHGN